MTLQEVMNSIHARYEMNDNFYVPGDVDFETRLILVNLKVSLWAGEPGVLWRELFRSASGDLVAGKAYLPSDFHSLSGKLQLGSLYYEFVSPEFFQESIRFGGRCVFTILYDDGGAYLQTPGGENSSFSFPYYKKASQYTSADLEKHLEMSEPMFVVHSVVGDLYLDDRDSDKASVEFQVAGSLMEAMKYRNNNVSIFGSRRMPNFNDRGFGN